MIESIDHILVHVEDAKERTRQMEELFGIEAYIQPYDYRYFTSAMFRFGNVDIEILQMGEREGFAPYLYGIAFAPVFESWKTIEMLQQKQIPHTLPSKIEVPYHDSTLVWQAITLGGFLDDAFSIPYSTGYMAGNNPLAKGMAKFFDGLMGMGSMRKMATKKIGTSILFFCEYLTNPKALRDKATQSIKDIGGGTYAIECVETIMIETKEQTLWQSLGNPKDPHSPTLTFIPSQQNRLKQIVLKSTNSYNNKEIKLGELSFLLL